jgi:hypothetical protein
VHGTVLTSALRLNYSREISTSRSCEYKFVHGSDTFPLSRLLTSVYGKIHEICIGKYMEGSGRSLIRILPRYRSGRSEENNEKLQLG